MTARDCSSVIGGWAATGAVCGAATGTAHGAIGLWLAIGAAIGLLLGVSSALMARSQ